MAETARAVEVPLPRARMDQGRALTTEALMTAASRIAPPTDAVAGSVSGFAAAPKPSLFARLAAANRQARADAEARRAARLQEASAPAALGQLVTVPGPEGTDIPLTRTTCDGASSFVAAFIEPEAVEGRGRCGIAEPMRVAALTKAAIAVGPSATLNCPVTEALADWTREAVMPAAKEIMGSKPVRIVNAASYACRSRGHRRGARLSEHAFGNALDIRAFVMEDGSRIEVKRHPKGSKEARFLASVREAACTHFTTVLGPGFDRAHADHFHFDLARHTASGDYRFCR